MSERQGIEIDYCPQCRGVWLDRGELDKLIEKSAPEKIHREYSGDFKQEKKFREDDKYNKYGNKRKGLLGELFDF